MIGVPCVTDDRTTVEPPKTDWLATRSGVDGDRVGEDAGTGAHGQPAGDLLALRRRRQQHRCRGAVGHDLGEHLRLRRDDVVGQVGALGDVDAGSTELGELVARGLETGTDEDGAGLTQRTRQGQQLGRDLLDVTVDVLDEDQDLCHRELLVLLR